MIPGPPISLSDEEMRRLEWIVELAEFAGFLRRPMSPRAFRRATRRWARWLARRSRSATLMKLIREEILCGAA